MRILPHVADVHSKFSQRSKSESEKMPSSHRPSEHEIRQRVAELKEGGEEGDVSVDLAKNNKKVWELGQDIVEKEALSAKDALEVGEQTREKLKDILSTGAFSFSSRERDVLDQILNNR